jgi:ADP-ribose pyrophosphatase YjhB (NUDIX family)
MADEKGYSLIVDVAVLANDRTLLLRYKDPESYDGQGGWFIPDDDIKYLEHPDDAAKRLVKDQLGLRNLQLVLDHMESFAGNNGTWHLVFHYKITLNAEPVLQLGENVAVAQWFDLHALPNTDEVAHHGWALGTLKKIQANANR